MAVSTVTDLAALPAVLTMGHVQRTLGVAKKTAYDLAHRDDFPAIRLGRTIRVPREAFLRWLDGQVEGEANGHK
jgi:excisionase family DNA binding protein